MAMTTSSSTSVNAEPTDAFFDDLIGSGTEVQPLPVNSADLMPSKAVERHTGRSSHLLPATLDEPEDFPRSIRHFCGQKPGGTMPALVIDREVSERLDGPYSGRDIDVGEHG
jgi:hypothetical protein